MQKVSIVKRMKDARKKMAEKSALVGIDTVSVLQKRVGKVLEQGSFSEYRQRKAIYADHMEIFSEGGRDNARSVAIAFYFADGASVIEDICLFTYKTDSIIESSRAYTFEEAKPLLKEFFSVDCVSQNDFFNAYENILMSVRVEDCPIMGNAINVANEISKEIEKHNHDVKAAHEKRTELNKKRNEVTKKLNNSNRGQLIKKLEDQLNREKELLKKERNQVLIDKGIVKDEHDNTQEIYRLDNQHYVLKSKLTGILSKALIVDRSKIILPDRV